MIFTSLRNILFVNKEGGKDILNEQSVKKMQSHPLSEMGKSTRSKLFEAVVQDDELFRLVKQQLRRSPQRALTNDGLAEVLHEPEFLKNLATVVMEANRVKRERTEVESHVKSLLLQSQRNVTCTGSNSSMMTSQQRPIYTVVEKRGNTILPALRKASVVIQRGRQSFFSQTDLPSRIVSHHPQHQQDGVTPTRRCQLSEGSCVLQRSLTSRSNKIWNFVKPAPKSHGSSSWSLAEEETDGAFARNRKSDFKQEFLDLTSPEECRLSDSIALLKSLNASASITKKNTAPALS
jgi:hypothetical protein